MLKFALFLGFLTLAPSAATAQSIEAILREFGLLGAVWAADCGQKPSTSNWYARYAILPSGEGQLIYDPGTGAPNAYLIHGAERVAEDQLLLNWELQRDHKFQTVVIRVAGDRYRTISARHPDGTYQVKDGVFADNGKESPWLNRCPA